MESEVSGLKNSSLKTLFLGEAYLALGLDYGTRSIGLATGQSLTCSATELTNLRYNETKKSKNQVVIEIQKLIEQWNPKVLVIGWPLNMDGSESELCQAIKKFSRQLAHVTSVPIEFMDERLTSYEAKTEAKQERYNDRASKNRNFKKEPIDALAAKIILESWFQQRAN